MDCFSNCSVPVGQHVNQTSSLEINPTLLEVYNIYLYLMIVLGISGNFVVLIVFSKLPPNTTTDWFILSITTCDFIMSFVNVPVYVTFTNGLWKYFGNNVICILHMFISQSLVLSSAFLICGLALDRYFKVCKPMTPYPKTRARNICLVISLLTTLLSLPSFVMFENREGRCQSVSMGYGLFVYYLFVFLTFILAVAVVVFSYAHVTRRVRGSVQNIDRHNHLINISRGTKSVRVRKLNRVAPCSGSKTSPYEMFRECGTESTVSNVQRHNKVFENNAQVNNFFIVDASKKTIHGSTVSYLSSPGPAQSAPSQEDRVLPNISNEIQVLSAPGTVTVQRCSLNKENSSTVSATQNQEVNTGQLATIRTTQIAFLVCTIFIVTWIPPWTSFILSAIPEMKENGAVVNFMMFGRMTHLINTMTNPILYTWLNRKFRRNIIKIFLCRN